jgi:hypothetical protein
MSSEASAETKRRALREAVFTLSKTSKYQDRWIADVDVEAAIRHEFDLWDASFSKEITYTKINAAIKADIGLDNAIDGPDAANKTGIFRKDYKPTSVSITRKKDDGKYTREKKKVTRKTFIIHAAWSEGSIGD